MVDVSKAVVNAPPPGRDRQIDAQITTSSMFGIDKERFMREAKPGEVQVLGVLLARCGGLSFRNNPQDEEKPAIALTGVFEFTPSNPQRPVLRATRCYLPTTIQEMVVRAMQGGRDAPISTSPKKGKAVDISVEDVVVLELEIAVERNNSSIGYSYKTRELERLQLEDPLVDLRIKHAARLGLPVPAEARAETVADGPGNAPAKAKK